MVPNGGNENSVGFHTAHLLLRRELITLLEIVAVAGRQKLFVLEPAHNDAGSHTYLGGNVTNRRLAVDPHPMNRLPLRGRDERFGREAVGLFLFLRVGAVPLHEYFLLSMQEDVPHLVEERKPQVIVGPVTQAQLD